jgi:hypothetical protein
MTRYVVQRGPCDYVAVDASSPRAAANRVVGDTRGVIVWYRARSSWASWADAEQGRTRYLGKIDERVVALLNRDASSERNE